MQPLLLCVHMDQARLMRLSLIAISLGVTVREVKEGEQGQSLAALCNLEPVSKNPPCVQVTEEVMVFVRFPDALLDQFLSEMKKDHLPPVRLKAILTPHNRSWNCGQLCAMLSQEAFTIDQSGKGKQK